MAMHFPGESAAYRTARDELLRQELALRRATEAVASARRALPPGGALPQDYAFTRREGGREGGAERRVRLSELFRPGHDTLAIYSWMFGPEREAPCPMCTALLDGLEASAVHIEQRVSLAVVARSPAAKLAEFVERRGWQHLRVLSAAGTSYSRDYHAESDDGDDVPILNVFSRRDGTVRHFWAPEMMDLPSDPGQDPRALDSLGAIYGLFDLTPEGRGDFYTKLAYDD
jgi:predicted dithiol-disulfide oxidoreductase (DUF899 family)